MDSSSRHSHDRNEEFDAEPAVLPDGKGPGAGVFGDSRFPAPAVPSRVYFRGRRRDRQTEDLNGKRIGLKTYQATAILPSGTAGRRIRRRSDQHRLDHRTGPSTRRRASISTRRRPGRTFRRCWRRARSCGHLPTSSSPFYAATTRWVACSNYRTEEEAYYKRTGIFPIMHATAIRDEIQKNIANNWPRRSTVPTRSVSSDEQSADQPLAWFRRMDAQRELLGLILEYGRRPPTGKTWRR